MEIIKEFRSRSIDFLTLLVFLRIIYSSIKSGLFSEGIKITGVFLGSFFSLQFYPFFLRKYKSEVLKQAYLDFFSVILIFCGIAVLFFLLVKVFMMLEKERKISPLERIFSLCVGMMRASLLVSIFIFSFSFLPPNENPYKGSLSSKFLKQVAPWTYIYSFKFFEKINPSWQFNEEVKIYEVKKDL